MKIIIIVNPHAGRQTILKDIDVVQTAWENAGHQVTTVLTATPEQASRIIRLTAAAGSKDVALVCCGGDGTLSETVSQLLEIGGTVPLGYIPAGTTNDFASSLGLSLDPAVTAEKLLAAKPRPLDVGRFGEKKFIYVASFGAFTQSSYSTDQNMKNALGHFAYVLEGLKELPVLRAYKMRVETAEGPTFEGEYIFGAVSNSTSLGGVIKVDPASVSFGDGLFELLLVKNPTNLGELNRVVVSLLSGKPDEELVAFTHTKKAVFFCEEPMPWSLDGEYAEGGDRIEAEVLPGAVQMYY